MSDLKTAANQVLDAYISINWLPYAIGKKLNPPMATLMAAVTQESESDSSAELRHLQAEHVEDQGVIAVWRGRTLRAEAQRDALLEAIKELIAAERSEGKATGGFIPQAATREHQRRVLLAWQAVHDAINAAEENQ